jgi:hypothetical protein
MIWSTGVDLTWLTNNDPTGPMISATGHPYSHADFEDVPLAIVTRRGLQ